MAKTLLKKLVAPRDYYIYRYSTADSRTPLPWRENLRMNNRHRRRKWLTQGKICATSIVVLMLIVWAGFRYGNLGLLL